jgi:hypothetical protein
MACISASEVRVKFKDDGGARDLADGFQEVGMVKFGN